MSDEVPPETEDRDAAPQTLRRSARGRISLVWIIPILAVILGASLIIQNYLGQGPTIEIEFPEAAGIEAGVTPIKFLNVEVGIVQEVRLKESSDGVIAIAELEPSVEDYLREGTVFWLVQPRISLAGISGIETLLSGQYIEVVPSPEGAYTTSFRGALEPPVGSRHPLAKHIVLETDRLGSIGQGTPITHRGLLAGEVEHVELGEAGEPMQVYAVIDEEFATRVRETSRFWNSSGVDAHVGLDGVQVRTDGLTALLTAGISFDSPDPKAPEATNGSRFSLFAGADEAQEATRRRGSLLIHLESRDGIGLSPGTIIYYRGIEIGWLGDRQLTPDARAVRIDAFIEERYRRLVIEDARFFKSSGIDVSFGIDGLRVQSEALRAVALGGVSLAVPKSESEVVENETVFALYDEPQSEWLAWNPAIALDETMDPSLIEHQLPPEPHSGALELSLTATDLGGLSEGAPVVFHRVPVGRVIRTSLRTDGSAVDVRIRIDLDIDREFAPLVRSNSRFWSPDAVHIEASLAGIEVEAAPVQALLAGGVMLATPPAAAEAAPNGAIFRLEEDAPPGWEQWNPDLTLGAGEPSAFAATNTKPDDIVYILVASDAEAIGRGAPIYYRGLEIGSVGIPRLDRDGTRVQVEARVAPEYEFVIRTNTQFWNVSGLNIDLGWGGVSAETGPLDTVIRGGIQLATPTPAGERASPGDRFELRAEPEEGWRDWKPELR